MYHNYNMMHVLTQCCWLIATLGIAAASDNAFDVTCSGTIVGITKYSRNFLSWGDATYSVYAKGLFATELTPLQSSSMTIKGYETDRWCLSSGKYVIVLTDNSNGAKSDFAISICGVDLFPGTVTSFSLSESGECIFESGSMYRGLLHASNAKRSASGIDMTSIEMDFSADFSIDFSTDFSTDFSGGYSGDFSSVSSTPELSHVVPPPYSFDISHSPSMPMPAFSLPLSTNAEFSFDPSMPLPAFSLSLSTNAEFSFDPSMPLPAFSLPLSSNVEISFDHSMPLPHMSLDFSLPLHSLDFSMSQPPSDTTSPTATPTTSPTCEPTLSPTAMPTVNPTALPTPAAGDPTFAPTLAPTPHPSVNPTLLPTLSPTVSPTFSPTAIPSSVPTLAPTLSEGTLMMNAVDNFLADFELTDAKRSTYSEVFVQDEQVSGGCDAWTNYILDDVATNLIVFAPAKITFAAARSSSESIVNNTVTCDVDSVVGDIVEALTNVNSQDTDSMDSFACNGTSWNVGACVSGKPALCIDCADPCQATADLYAVNCNDPAEDGLHVLLVDYKLRDEPPEILSIAFDSPSKFSIRVNITLNEASGAIVCAAYHTVLSFVPSDVGILAVQNDLVDINDTVMEFIIPNLQAGTSYDVFCGTYSDLELPMDPSLLTSLAGTQVTQCCQPLTVSLLRTMFNDNSDVGNAIRLNTGIYPPLDLIVTVNAYHTVTNAMISAFVPSGVTFSATTNPSRNLGFTKSPSGTYRVEVTLSGASASAYVVSYPVTQMFTIQASNVEPAAPTMDSAIFGNSGVTVVVVFKSLTNRAGYVNNFFCTNVFSMQGITSTSICKWVDDRTVEMYVSGNDAVSVGGNVTLKSQKLKAKCTVANCASWAYSSSHSTSVQAPLQPIVPAVALTGPNMIGPCDTLPIDASSSKGSGGRSWDRITFQVSSDAVNATKLQAYLNSLTQLKLQSVVYVPLTYFQPGFAYNIKLQICNFLGSCGRDALPFVVSTASNIPVVVMNSDKIISVRRSNQLTLSGSSYTSKCDGTQSTSNLVYSWSFYRGNDLLVSSQFKSTSVNPKEFLLPAYRLQVNTLYVATLTVRHTASQKYSAVSTTIVVQPGSVYAVVAGGSDMNMRVSGSALIDASGSYDSDNNANKGVAAGLNIVFLCHQTYPSYKDDCGLTTVASNGKLTVTVPNQNTSFIDSQHEIVVSVIHGTDKRSDSTTVKLTIIPSLSALVTVWSKDGVRVNADKKLTIFGTVDYQSAGTAMWTASDPSVDLNAYSPVTTSLVATGGSVRKTLSMIVPAYTLAESGTYVFALAASITGGATFGASVTVTINSPPTSGTLSIDPTSGEEFNTVFDMTSPKWEDPDLPVSYEFAHGASGDGNYIVFRARKQLSHTKSKLPSGVSADNSYFIKLQVYDVLDGKSSTLTTVSVTNAEVSNDDLANDLTNSLDGDASDVKESTAIVNEIVNSVSCDGMPESTCNSYNRKPCSRVEDTCGKCKPGYSGASGHDNSYCTSKFTQTAIRKLSSVAATCSSDADCSGSFEECSSGVCTVPEKTCVKDCSGATRGKCNMVYVFDHNITYSSCNLINTECVPKCECLAGYGGAYCQYTTSELASVQAVRALLLQGYQTLMSSENPSRDTFLSWISGLSTVAVSEYGLNEASRVLLNSLALDLIEVAKELDLSYEDLDGMKDLLDLTISLYFDSSRRRLGTSSISLDLLEKFRDFAFDDLADGQNPIEVISDKFRFIVASLDGISPATVASPLSAFETSAGVTPQQIALPGHYNFEPFKVSLTEIVQDALSSSFDPMYQSVLLDVAHSVSLCNETAAGPCLFNITLQNFVFGAAVSPEEQSYTTQCWIGLESNHTYNCPSGINASTQCNGTYEGYIVSKCPIHIPTSICASVGDYVGTCSVLDFTEQYTSCSCTLPHHTDPKESTYASYATSELQYFGNSYVSDSSGGKGDNSVVWIVFIMILCLLSFFVFETCKRYFAKSTGEKDVGGVVRDDMSAVDDFVPYIFRSQSFFSRVWDELRLHHQWISVLHQKSATYPRALNMLSLLTKIILVYFFEAILYNFVDRNESYCKDDLTKSGCQEKKSFIALGGPMCDWDVNSEGEGYCHFREPDSDAMRTLFVAGLIACIIVPLWVPLNYMMLEILGTPECCSSRATVTMSHDEEAGGHSPGDESALGVSEDADYSALISAARQHASTLSGTEQSDFREAWALYDDDSDNAIIKDELIKTRATLIRNRPYMESSDVSDEGKRKKLFALFIADFLSGSGYTVFHNKMARNQRNAVTTSAHTRRLGWVFITCFDLGLLVYVFLFWSRQSRERQFSFFVSFMLWLLLDTCFISSGLFFWTHVILPSWIHRDVGRAKKKVLAQLMAFRQGGVAAVNSEEFNAAKYLFASFRLAGLVPSVPDGGAVLSYSTKWPRLCALTEKGSDVTTKGFMRGPLDRIVSAVAGMNFLVHDIVMSLLISVVVAGLSVLHVYLFRIEVGFIFIPIGILLGLLLVYTVCSRTNGPASVHMEGGSSQFGNVQADTEMQRLEQKMAISQGGDGAGVLIGGSD